MDSNYYCDNNGKKTRFRQKKLITVIISTLIILAALLSTVACETLSTPDGVVKKYFNAIKYGDIAKCFECLLPYEQANYKAANSFYSKLFGIDTEAFMDLILGSTNHEYYESYDFRIVDTD